MKKKVLRISCCALIFAILLLSTPLTLYAEEDDGRIVVTSASFYTISGYRYYLYETPESLHLTSDQISAINTRVASKYNVTKLSGPSSLYNCHSYAWHAQSTSNPYWMEVSDGVDVFIGDSHTERINPYSLEIGYIAVYYSNVYAYYEETGLVVSKETEIAHSAVVTGVSGDSVQLTSKWGNWGLYSHELSEVPREYMMFDTSTHTFYLDVEYYAYYTEHNTYGDVTAINGHIHSYHCSYCNCQMETENHIITGSRSPYDENYHKGTCIICDYDTSLESHTISGTKTPYNATHHKGTCSSCNYADSLEGHNFQYRSNGFKPTQTASHTKTCIDCNASYTEGHSLKYQANGTYICRYCGYITTSPGNDISSIEDELYKS